MDVLKGKIQERIVKLRDLSDYTAKVIEDAVLNYFKSLMMKAMI